MQLGGNFFRWLSFAVQAIRLLFRVFGDEGDKKAADESEERAKSDTPDAA